MKHSYVITSSLPGETQRSYIYIRAHSGRALCMNCTVHLTHIFSIVSFSKTLCSKYIHTRGWSICVTVTTNSHLHKHFGCSAAWHVGPWPFVLKGSRRALYISENLPALHYWTLHSTEKRQYGIFSFKSTEQMPLKERFRSRMYPTSPCPTFDKS